MQKYQDSVIDARGRPISGAVVTVTTLDGSPATIYSDNGVTPIVSLSTGVDGSFAFYAADGHYSIVISGDGFTTKSITDILIEDHGIVTVYAEEALESALEASVSAAEAAASADEAAASAVAAATAETNAETAETNAETAAATAQLLIATQRFATKALMDADLAHAAGTFAAVYADSTVSNNGIYYKVGGSGSGSWTAYNGTWVQALALMRAAVATRPSKFSLFDRDLASVDTLILSASGTTASIAGFYATGYMPVVGGDSYKVYPASTGLAAPYGMAWYDEDRVYISGTAAPFTNGQSFAAPSGACYARFTIGSSAQLSTFMFLPAAITPGTQDDQTPGSKGDDFAALIDALQFAALARPSKFNLFDAEQRSASSLVLSGSGGTAALGGYFATGYMPVYPGGTYKIYPASSVIFNPYGLAWYDRDRTYISGVDGAFTNGQSVVAPATAAYVRVTVNDSQLATFMFLPDSITAGNVMAHTLPTKSDFKQWAAKTVMQLGDSIAANTNWMATVATYLGITTVTNNSVSGRMMIDALKSAAGAALVSGDFTSVDLVHLHLGTNDFTNATTLGTISDSTATASFYGRAKLAIETMLGYKPTLRICIATLLQRTGGTGVNAGGWTLNDYNTALRAVAELYACPINDLAKTSGINAVTIATYLSDGLHPNAAGYTAGLVNPTKGFFDGLHPAT